MGMAIRRLGRCRIYLFDMKAKQSRAFHAAIVCGMAAIWYDSK